VRKPADNGEALAAFIAHKIEIDTILARLTTPSADHCGSEPDAVTWGHVGTLAIT
jgi:hypothetical protein